MPSFIGFWELIALAAVLLLLFGPRRLPEIGRSLGTSLREFKSSISGQHDRFAGPDEPAAEQVDEDARHDSAA